MTRIIPPKKNIGFDPKTEKLVHITTKITKIDEYKDWTKYHIIHTYRNQWKFYREGMKRSIITRKDRNELIKEALYYICDNGGYLTVHLKDGSLDFIVNNWCG